jgi:hypothetical protein
MQNIYKLCLQLSQMLFIVIEPKQTMQQILSSEASMKYSSRNLLFVMGQRGQEKLLAKVW